MSVEKVRPEIASPSQLRGLGWITLPLTHIFGWLWWPLRQVARRIKWLDPLYAPNALLREALQGAAPFGRGRLLDIGCGIKPYQDLFQVEEYIGLDVPSEDRPKVDLWGDGVALPFADNAFDTILCTEVLEHLPEPSLLLQETYRVLRPHGHLILTTPQTWGLHRAPHDYYRYTEYGLRYLAQKCGFEVVRIFPTSGLWATIGARISDVIFYDYARDWPWGIKRWLLPVCAAPQLLGLALERLAGKRGDTLDHLMVAKKKE